MTGVTPRIAALVVSCYELGHPPLAAATAAAFLARAGHDVRAVDLAVEPFERLAAVGDPQRVRLIAVSTPMHAALRVAVRAAARLREAFPAAHLCFFGLYAWLNAEHLLDSSCDSVVGGEFEVPLLELADALAASRPLDGVPGFRGRGGAGARPHLARSDFVLPDRTLLPPLASYSRLVIDGESRPAAAIEASRGCLHDCRHCPIPPIYGKRFFVVPRELVLQDVAQLVAQGARHVTFADPDFFNGPGHSMAIVRELHARWHGLTFDVTTKVENVLRHRDKLAELAASGCVFLVTAVESTSDEVLRNLCKGHTRADACTAAQLLRRAGIAMRPSFVPFTPWSTLADTVDLLEWAVDERLVEQIDAVQYSIRLLVPPGSLLLENDSLRATLAGLRPDRFSWDWRHPDPRMDRLHEEVSAIVRDAATAGLDAARTFARVRHAVHAAAGGPAPTRFVPARAAEAPPRLTEPWFC